MRISGFFKGNAPYILFNMRTEKPQTLRKIPFLIDTGSDIMGVALKDRVSMNMSLHCAGRRVGSISGLKEKARRGEINGEPRAITLMKFLTILQAMKYEKGRLAGTLLSIAALQWFFSVMVAEGLHKGFLVSANQWIPYSNQIHYVSELGIGPTAPIFNISTIVLGVMMMGASSLLHLQDKSKLLPSLLAISGIGAIGVGLFPTDIQPTHGIFQAFALLCGAFSAIVSYRTQEPPLSYISAGLGIVSFVTSIVFFPYLGLGVNDTSTFLGLGKGTLERIVIYTLILWIFSYGYHLAGKTSEN